MVFGGERSKRGKPAPRDRPALVGPIAFSLRSSGALEVVYAARPGVEASFGVTDETGARHPLAPEQRGQAAIAGLDLLDLAQRSGPAWKLAGGGRDSRVGVNFGEAWAIAGIDTWYARTVDQAATVLWFIDPGGGATPLTPGIVYRFELLAATHRCRAEVLLQLLNAQGQLIEELTRPVSPEARGGRTAEAYDRVLVEFETPQGAAALAIGVRKGGSAPGQDSFLFVAAPSLAPSGEGQPPLDLPTEAVERAKAVLRQGLAVERARLALPDGLLEGRPHELALLVEAGAGLQEAGGIAFTAGGALAGEDGAPEPGIVVSPLRATLDYNRAEDAQGRHLAAYRAWFERAEAGESPPDLDRLAQAIDAGRTGSVAPFKLEFPEADREVAVRVLLRGPGDLETYWLSLAGLLFAANRTAMRVAAQAPEADTAVRLGELLTGVEVTAPREEVTSDDSAFVVLLEPGWEPVAGWLDELRAVFDNFAGVGAAGPKLIESDGRLIAAGVLVGGKGEIEVLGAGGNPRDPRFGYVRPVDAVRPLMLTRAEWEARGQSADLLDPVRANADLTLRLQQQGRRVLYAPTAELWRLKGCDPAPEPTPAELARFKGHGAPLLAAREPPAGLRVLFVDQEAPTIDMDAGGYAAFQEMRVLQALGAKVDFLARNLAWMDRHTIALQRAGVECLHAPFVQGFDHYLRAHAADYDLIFVVRHKVARLVHEALGESPDRPKLVLNLADLHFLREAREAAAGTPGYTPEMAAATRDAELEAIAAADLTLTYSEVEAAVIESHTLGQAKVAIAPWVVETRDEPIASFEGSRGLMFLGGFGHPPNAEAVRRFAAEVMPLLAERLPSVKLTVIGSKPPPEVLALDGGAIQILGYVSDLDEVFATARVFVAPLFAGAGLKGKVIEALSRGVPTVLSPIAAEGTGLAHGHDCLIARTPKEWAEAIERLHEDPSLWERLARGSLETARRRFSFEGGVERMRRALALIDVHGGPSALTYRHARPDPHGGASSAPAVLRLP